MCKHSREHQCGGVVALLIWRHEQSNSHYQSVNNIYRFLTDFLIRHLIIRYFEFRFYSWSLEFSTLANRKFGLKVTFDWAKLHMGSKLYCYNAVTVIEIGYFIPSMFHVSLILFISSKHIRFVSVCFAEVHKLNFSCLIWNVWTFLIGATKIG